MTVPQSARGTIIDYALTAEAADPYCLRPGEAGTLLDGHPWRRLVVVGDSIARGIGDGVDGYSPLGWTDRIAAELTEVRPDLAYRNLGVSHVRVAEVRASQLGPAVEFAPDLAIVACGANDALRPQYAPAAVDAELTSIVTALRDAGAEVMTIALAVVPELPAFPRWFRPVAAKRLRVLSEHTNALGAELGTVHLDMSDHPVCRLAELILSRDGLHGNARGHAVYAAEAVRRLGAHLGNTFPA
jgi:lysophospholipase L1-like esterase